MLGRFSTRGRIMAATGLATLPMLALLISSAIERYGADRNRAERGAENRAVLIATLLKETSGSSPPSSRRLDHLMRLGSSVTDPGAVVYSHGTQTVRAGPAPVTDDPEALEHGSGVFQSASDDEVDRLWGLATVGNGPLVVAYGLPGDAVYGPARSALRRNIGIALAALVLVVFASFLLAGRVTAPIRRLAESIGEDGASQSNELGAIERGVVRNVEERRKLEDRLRLAQKLEAIGQLAGGVAHDFNNLLTVISGFSDVARRQIGAGPGASALREIERAADRASDLTRQLLVFARQQVIEPVALDINDVVRTVTPMLDRLIGEDVAVVVLEGDDVPRVVADRGQLEQAVTNLAINARDSMPSGGTVTIETRGVELDANYVSAHADVEPGWYACLVVTDAGTGIEADKLEHIFEPFYTTKEIGRGTGLGLATVHGIVAQAGGHIEVYSEPNLGTTFKLYFPASETEAPEPSEEFIPPERLRGAETVLVCEDEVLVRGLIEQFLTDEGYHVIATGAPDDALRVAAQERIDVLVTDVILPGMPGPKLAMRMRDTVPDLPTLFLSGYTFETVRDRGNLPPDSTFLEKPFRREDLLHRIRELIDQAVRRRDQRLGEAP